MVAHNSTFAVKDEDDVATFSATRKTESGRTTKRNRDHQILLKTPVPSKAKHSNATRNQPRGVYADHDGKTFWTTKGRPSSLQKDSSCCRGERSLFAGRLLV